MGPGFPQTFAPSGEHGVPTSESARAGPLPKSTAMGAIAVTVAKPMNLRALTIRAFLDNICSLATKLNGCTLPPPLVTR